MSNRRDSLSPPERPEIKDPGAHELDSASDTDDHFSDAKSVADEASSPSPIPRTRVEKVDDEPSYGEVPGTEAYRKREQDAEPDEIAVVPDPTSPAPRSRANSEIARPTTPGGHPIPKTMVEETPDSPGSVRHPEIEKKHRADPPPDLVLKADGERVEGQDASDSPISPLKSPRSPRSRRKSSVAKSPGLRSAGFGAEQADDDFGDDFDDFEEGGDEGDFGDFDDGFQEPAVDPVPAAAPPPAAAAPPAASAFSFPIPDFDDLDYDEILSTTDPYLNALFPMDESDFPALPPLPKDSSIFQTPRSASLWDQLVAPPPLQPPDWIRSRIRRLFLVSLGVPVDLDEILPASKQKKLVLPSLHRANSTGSLRSTDSRRLKRGGEAGASNSSQSKEEAADPASSGSGVAPASSRRKKGPPQPSIDLVSAKQLCMTTDAALDGMTDEELKAHLQKLKELEGAAHELLEFWTKLTDEKIGDREAFEGVIENLVQHARKVRK